MKRSSADIWFSKAIRLAADNICAWCGRQFERTEASHIHGRRHRTIRWDKLNCVCKCHTCHRKWHENPTEGAKWFQGKYGQHHIDVLLEKKNRRTRISKIEEKEIGRYYKKICEEIERKRKDGVGGYIDFESYQ